MNASLPPARADTAAAAAVSAATTAGTTAGTTAAIEDPIDTLAADPPRPRRWVAPVVGVLLVVSLMYVFAVAWLWLRQEAMLFHPEPLPADQRLSSEADVQEFSIDVPGAKLSAMALRLPQPRGVVFFLHGNNSNLATWFVNTELYRRANLDLVMVDYRGYGKSTGRIESEAQLMADVRTAWQQVAPRYEGLQRIFYGRSLGSGLAAQLAAEVQPELTVLVSPYRSMVALAREKYPFVPPFALRYPLRTDLAMPKIHTPVLLVHGRDDTLIAPSHSEALASLAPNARLELIDGAGHGDIHRSPAYLQVLTQALGQPDRSEMPADMVDGGSCH